MDCCKFHSLIDAGCVQFFSKLNTSLNLPHDNDLCILSSLYEGLIAQSFQSAYRSSLRPAYHIGSQYAFEFYDSLYPLQIDQSNTPSIHMMKSVLGLVNSQ